MTAVPNERSLGLTRCTRTSLPRTTRRSSCSNRVKKPGVATAAFLRSASRPRLRSSAAAPHGVAGAGWRRRTVERQARRCSPPARLAAAPTRHDREWWRGRTRVRRWPPRGVSAVAGEASEEGGADPSGNGFTSRGGGSSTPGLRVDRDRRPLFAIGGRRPRSALPARDLRCN